MTLRGRRLPRRVRARPYPRIAVLLAAAAVAVLSLGAPASGHALLRFADPADGANLDEPPERITLTFTEPLEPTLSQILVEDEEGPPVQQGEAELAVDEPMVLSIPLQDLDEGVYTVTWQVVSTVDGHPTAGIFAFGVGVDPPERGQEEVDFAAAPTATPGEIAARALLYVGFALLLGAAMIGAVAFDAPPRSVLRLALLGAVLATLGGAGVGLAQARAADASVGEVLGTAIGRSAALRAGFALAAALAILLPVGSARRRLLLGAGLGAVAILVHVAGGHAGAEEPPWPQVASQWAHVTAAALWVGGLASLLVGVRGAPDDTTATAIRRYSRMAGYALAVVALSGLFRALDEVGGWSALWSTGYGRFVAAKTGLLLVLAGLGALNRYRMVPRAPRELRGFRIVSGTELVVAIGAFTAAAALATLVPPASIPYVPRAPRPDRGLGLRRVRGAPGAAGGEPGDPGAEPLRGLGPRCLGPLAARRGRRARGGPRRGAASPDDDLRDAPRRPQGGDDQHLHLHPAIRGWHLDPGLPAAGRGSRSEIHFLLLDPGGEELFISEEPEILAGPVGVDPLVLRLGVPHRRRRPVTEN